MDGNVQQSKVLRVVAGAGTQQEGLAVWLGERHVNAKLFKAKCDSMTFDQAVVIWEKHGHSF